VYHRALAAADVEALAAGKEPAPPYATPTPELRKRVRALVAGLGADTFEQRERAAAELRAMGRPIYPLLKRYARAEGPEVSARIRSILGALPGSADDDPGEGK
jgi:hypothetical protein